MIGNVRLIIFRTMHAHQKQYKDYVELEKIVCDQLESFSQKCLAKLDTVEASHVDPRRLLIEEEERQYMDKLRSK